MPTARVNGVELYYEETGEGFPLVFSHEYAGDYRSWEAQVRYFGVAQLGPDGRIAGEHVFIGLLSTKALKQANRRIPVVGQRIRQVMAKLEEQKGSYAYTKSVAILDSIPVEDLFYWSIEEIRNVVESFRLAESKDQARVFVWRRPGGRRVTVVCVVPRMRFSEALREELSQEIRNRVYPDSRLKGQANLLIMPNLDAANISFNLLKMTGGEGVTIGPILLGAARPVHVLTPSATVRRLVNMTALAAVDAGA